MSVTIKASQGIRDLNVANGNFSTLWNALGLPLEHDDDWVGEIGPIDLAHRLNKTQKELVVRSKLTETFGEEGEGRIKFINCALGREQVERYYIILSQIIVEATHHNCQIVWY